MGENKRYLDCAQYSPTNETACDVTMYGASALTPLCVNCPNRPFNSYFIIARLKDMDEHEIK
jgi:hypothetical protein